MYLAGIASIIKYPVPKNLKLMFAKLLQCTKDTCSLSAVILSVAYYFGLRFMQAENLSNVWKRYEKNIYRCLPCQRFLIIIN